MIFCLTYESHPFLLRVVLNIAPHLLIDTARLKESLSSSEFKVKVTATNSLRRVSSQADIEFFIKDPEPSGGATLAGLLGAILCSVVMFSLTLTGDKIYHALNRY